MTELQCSVKQRQLARRHRERSACASIGNRPDHATVELEGITTVNARDEPQTDITYAIRGLRESWEVAAKGSEQVRAMHPTQR